MSDRSEADCVSNDLVERVARALSEDRGYDWDKHVNFRPAFRRMARAAIAVLRPALRAEAFEEAAKVVTEHYQELCTEHRLLLVNRAAAIRALVKQSTTEEERA